MDKLEYRLEGRPDYGFLTVTLPQGRTLKVEAGAMATQDTNIRMKTKMRGGIGRFLTGTRDLFLALLGLKEVPPAPDADKLNLVFTAPLEFFFTKLKLAGFGAVVLTFPVLAWQVSGSVAWTCR